jgi:hypothetical protein
MVQQRGTLELLADELGSALAGLQDVLQVDNLTMLLLSLGLEDPPAVGEDPQFVETLTAAADRCSAVETALNDLAEAVDADDPGARLRAVANVIEAVAALVGALDTVAEDLKRATHGTDNEAAIAAFAAEMVGRLLEAAVVYHLETFHPVVARVLAVLTVVEVTPLPLPPEPPPEPPPADSGDSSDVPADTPQTIPPTLRRLHLDRLSQLLQDPLAIMRIAYGWGDDNFDGKKLFLAIGQLSDALGSLSVIDQDQDSDAAAALSLSAMLFVPSPDVQPPGIDGLLHVDLAPATELVIARPSETWRLSLELASALGAGLELRLLPPADLALRPPEGTVEGAARLGFIGESRDAQTPFIIVGQSTGSRLQARRVEVGFLADLTFDPTAAQATADIGFEVTLVEGLVVIDVSESDGFLQSILPAGGITTTVNLAITWSHRDGIRIRGGAGLRTSIDVHATAGPLRLETLHLALEPAADALVLAATVTGAATLGPFVVTVDGVGAAAALRFQRGNLGPIDISGGFRPPTAIGVSVEVPAITGGGFVGLDPATGRYTGALELKLAEVSVGAVVLIETRPPGAAPGFSLLVMLSARFLPGVHLAFGITLTGVGGLVGLNRRIDVDALRERYASGTAGRLLAAEDPLRDLPALLTEVSAIFPPAEGLYVVGPTLQLQWAKLVTLDVGVFLEFPGPTRVVVLGTARASVDNPLAEGPLLRLRCDFVGVLDLAQSTFALDAVLIDSRLLESFPVTGGLMVRASWGAEPYVLFSAGGFHPDFAPGSLVLPKTLTRLAMSSGSPDDELFLRFEGYFAITPNSVQFGASVEVVAKLDSLGVRGFFGFDALIRFEPFYFQISFESSMRVQWRGRTLAGITVKGTLSGPGPVKFTGKACIEVLFFDICASASFELGSDAPPTVSPVSSAVGIIADELRNPANLRAVADDPAVTLHTLPVSTSPILPATGIVWEQTRAPLGLLLERFEGSPLRRTETVGVIGDAVSDEARDWFAPGSFAELNDAEALTRRSFERLQSGVRLAAGDDHVSEGRPHQVDVKEFRVPAPTPVPQLGLPPLDAPSWLMEAAQVREGRSDGRPPAPAITVDFEPWQVVDLEGRPMATSSEAQAHQHARVIRGAVAIPAGDEVALPDM